MEEPQQDKGSDCLSELGTSEAAPQILCSVLGLSLIKTLRCWRDSREGQKGW